MYSLRSIVWLLFIYLISLTTQIDTHTFLYASANSFFVLFVYPSEKKTNKKKHKVQKVNPATEHLKTHTLKHPHLHTHTCFNHLTPPPLSEPQCLIACMHFVSHYSPSWSSSSSSGLLAPMPGMVAPGMPGMGGMGMMIPGHPHMLPMMQPRFRWFDAPVRVPMPPWHQQHPPSLQHQPHLHQQPVLAFPQPPTVLRPTPPQTPQSTPPPTQVWPANAQHLLLMGAASGVSLRPAVVPTAAAAAAAAAPGGNAQLIYYVVA